MALKNRVEFRVLSVDAPRVRHSPHQGVVNVGSDDYAAWRDAAAPADPAFDAEGWSRPVAELPKTAGDKIAKVAVRRLGAVR